MLSPFMMTIRLWRVDYLYRHMYSLFESDALNGGAMEKTIFNRSYRNLSQKFLQYLFPTMMTTVALSLNEFVDSMLVANLLGSRAMAVVSLGFPVMLLMATICQLYLRGCGLCSYIGSPYIFFINKNVIQNRVEER